MHYLFARVLYRCIVISLTASHNTILVALFADNVALFDGNWTNYRCNYLGIALGKKTS